MRLNNLEINKIIIHEIHQRDLNGKVVLPDKSNDFIRFDPDAMTTFKSRVFDALGGTSKAVEMSILNQGCHDVSSLIDKMPTADDTEYVDLSYNIAKKLAEAQTRRNIPGGIVVIFSGTFGDHNRNFIGIMKAEIYSAYQKVKNESSKEISLKFVKEALLTPATKLYKTAGFFQINERQDKENLNDKWSALVSDYQISQTDGKAAANYFYSSFLGCGYPESSARTTKAFYDATSDFLNKIEVSEETRNFLHNSLIYYLKYENTDVVNPTEFAKRYFDTDTRDVYAEYLDGRQLPTTSFTKDIEYISSNLKHRKISFSKNVKVTAPSKIFNDLIEFESITEDELGQPVNWTRIMVKDNIVAQE